MVKATYRSITDCVCADDIIHFTQCDLPRRVRQRLLGVGQYITQTCPYARVVESGTPMRGRPESAPERERRLNQHHALVHTVSKAFERLAMKHAVEVASPFPHGYHSPPGRFRSATLPAYRNKGLHIDLAFPSPQAAEHFESGSAAIYGSPAAKYQERKSSKIIFLCLG